MQVGGLEHKEMPAADGDNAVRKQWPRMSVLCQEDGQLSVSNKERPNVSMYQEASEENTEAAAQHRPQQDVKVDCGILPHC